MSTSSERKTRRIPLDLRSLSGRDEVFRLSGGVKRDHAIDRWLADEPIKLRSIARKWFLQMRQCGDDVRELMHDGCPVACVRDAPFGYVNTFKTHVNIGFFRGAHLKDADGLLEGSGKHMRHVKLRPGHGIDEAALKALIGAAYTDMKARLEAEEG